MILYTTALLLLSAYSSEGARLPLTLVDGSVASSLNRLANVCENKFIFSQINSSLNECNVVVPPYTETALQCLIFYDMSQQLCAAVSSAKLALNEDYSTLINQTLDVLDLCKVAKGWQATDLPEYTQFKSMAGKVFQNDNLCAKLCGVTDVFSSESNYFCKYFNWGFSVLSSIQSTYMTNAVMQETNAAANAAAAALKPAIRISTQSATEKPQLTSNNTEHTSNADVKVENPSANSDIKDIEVNEKTVPAKPVLPQQKPVENIIAVSQPSVEPQSVDGSENMDKPILADLQPAPPAETKMPEEKPKAGNAPDAVGAGFMNQPNVDKIKKPVPDVELGDQDYQDQDLEDGKEGLADMQGGDDGDDPILMEQENKLVQEQPKVPNKIQTPSSYAADKGINFHDISTKTVIQPKKQKEIPPMTKRPLTLQKPNEMYANNFGEAYSNGDDHFFPFFLTSIILVALLYVLYHNKSKVSKVVLGLIVEGRQNGRRRNSRGHSYRRLDTLEQAMSAPTAAAPSKIIY